jgi:hypothetical protein
MFQPGASVRPVVLALSIVGCLGLAAWLKDFGPVSALVVGALGGMTYGYCRENRRRHPGGKGARLRT